MGACCSPRGCDEFFDDKVARRDARRYRKKGVDAAAQRVVDLVRAHGVEGATVLEIGGGVGGIQLELLKAGAARTTNVELSPAYDRYAQELAREAGVADRVTRLLANVAGDGAEVEPADVVVMHRVVCCYPDYEALVGAAAARARRLLVLTYPPRNAASRLVVAAQNAFFRLARREFRTFAHPHRAVLAAAQPSGLRVVVKDRKRVWLIGALERVQPVSEPRGSLEPWRG
jgi:2-polyprenyl-3-methyl-5-hydroxy-6-metoxy-1,4-benzoquinol methylase